MFKQNPFWAPKAAPENLLLVWWQIPERKAQHKKKTTKATKPKDLEEIVRHKHKRKQNGKQRKKMQA